MEGQGKADTSRRNRKDATMTKKTAAVAGNGKAGRLIAKESAERGIDVTAFVRSASKTAADKAVVKDIMDLTAKDLAGFDAVVDAFVAWTPEALDQHSTTLAHLCDCLSGTNVRLLVVGGAGSLYVSPKHTLAVSDTPDFPDAFKPLAAAMAKALGKLRERSNVKWTYISPAGYFRAKGKRTGPYILGGEELTLADAGESVISYTDYAIAMIDEIETGNHLQQRVSTERKQHNIVKCSSKSGNALPLDTASLTR